MCITIWDSQQAITSMHMDTWKIRTKIIFPSNITVNPIFIIHIDGQIQAQFIAGASVFGPAQHGNMRKKYHDQMLQALQYLQSLQDEHTHLQQQHMLMEQEHDKTLNDLKATSHHDIQLLRKEHLEAFENRILKDQAAKEQIKNIETIRERSLRSETCKHQSANASENSTDSYRLSGNQKAGRKSTRIVLQLSVLFMQWEKEVGDPKPRAIKIIVLAAGKANESWSARKCRPTIEIPKLNLTCQ
ncbi:hypothetical protein R3P38DRAFT_2756411 [Favolaschia claudopus]|uniref:Uncharacterized protein n=1 Tax=Favolaschia claudopus TaxID=2862362 RepID=A0AAW0EEL1_9AGAR